MMQEQNKVYGMRLSKSSNGRLFDFFNQGFTISLFEWQQTIPTLWSTVKEFIKEFPEYLAENNSMSWLSNDGGESYNLCHCTS